MTNTRQSQDNYRSRVGQPAAGGKARRELESKSRSQDLAFKLLCKLSVGDGATQGSDRKMTCQSHCQVRGKMLGPEYILCLPPRGSLTLKLLQKKIFFAFPGPQGTPELVLKRKMPGSAEQSGEAESWKNSTAVLGATG